MVVGERRGGGEVVSILQVVVSVSEIYVLFGAPTGCTSPKTVRPGISPCTLFTCSFNKHLKNRAPSRGNMRARRRVHP